MFINRYGVVMVNVEVSFKFGVISTLNLQRSIILSIVPVVSQVTPESIILYFLSIIRLTLDQANLSPAVEGNYSLRSQNSLSKPEF